MHPDEHLRTQTAKTTENCVKGCVDSSQIVALKEDLNFCTVRKHHILAIFSIQMWKSRGNLKEIPILSYKRLISFTCYLREGPH